MNKNTRTVENLGKRREDNAKTTWWTVLSRSRTNADGFSDFLGACAFLTFFHASGPLIAPYPFAEREVLKASRAWKRKEIYIYVRIRERLFLLSCAGFFRRRADFITAHPGRSTSRISHGALAGSLISSNESKNFHSRALLLQLRCRACFLGRRSPAALRIRTIVYVQPVYQPDIATLRDAWITLDDTFDMLPTRLFHTQRRLSMS